MKKTFIFFLFTVFIIACNKDKDKEPIDNDGINTTPNIENTLGYGVLEKIQGIWNGPVTSTTPLGGYPEWIVDFRAISESQISAKNELDTLNDIHMSFFIALYNNQHKVCFRNGGSFGGQKRISYFLADSVSETSAQSFYRFTEIVNGKSRAYTEVIFRSDSLYIKSYTNKYNTQTTATPHMVWSAKLQDTTSAQPAASHFDFPKKTKTRDFTNTFSSVSEAVYYSLASDPYPEADQPYLGQTTVNYTYAGSYTPDPSKKVFLIITTQPLISGISINTGNLIYRSRYVILAANDQSFTFNYMHPGTYYLYAVYDSDGNNYFSSGDWVSTSNTTFTLSPLGNTTASTQINFTIP